MHPLLASMLVLAATWDAWRWYFARVWEAPEEAATLVFTVVFLAGLGLARLRQPAPQRPLPLVALAMLLTAYAASYAFLPPIMRAAIAIATALFCLHVAAFRARPPIAFWGLSALAMPLLPSLQHTLGYPMRVVSAALTVVLLNLNGLAVARQGTFLLWHDEMVQFDAPCSGVNMLWAGLLLTLMGCALFHFRPAKTVVAVTLSILLAIAANVLRASGLFYVEAGLLPQAPTWWHEGIGIAAFTMSAGVTLWLLGRLREREANA